MIVYEKTKGLTNAPLSYCPGCTHGIIHKLVAEVLEEMNLLKKAVGLASVGCSVMSYYYFDTDMVQAPHGRACAVATGIKRTHPDNFVFTYQGDGDLASIGLAETIHAANRGENITVIFVNNGIYGMTGGQMAPTTLLGAKTTTSPFGRNEIDHGMPIKISEMFATIPKAAYVERLSVSSPQAVKKAKKSIEKAFKYQLEKKGFTILEFLSTCPVNWGLTPKEALDYLDKEMTKYYPLGVYKDVNSDA
ncbi:MAG: thiamine pyrophosphate-dependent enzyme [Acholeplasmatales bacterium]